MAYSTQAPRSRLAWTRRCLLRVRDQTAPPVGAARNLRTKAAGPRPSPASGGGSSYVLIAMDEQEFRRMLELFPVVRSRNYCAESGSSNKGTTQQARAQEIKEANKKESSSAEDLFLQKLKMAAEKKIGATKAELFCKTFEDAHEKLVYKELNLDAARRFLNAYER